MPLIYNIEPLTLSYPSPSMEKEKDRYKLLHKLILNSELGAPYKKSISLSHDFPLEK